MNSRIFRFLASLPSGMKAAAVITLISAFPFPQQANATVTAQGTISFTFSVPPTYADYAYAPSNGYGFIGPSGSTINTYLNAAYSGSDTYLNNHVEAVWGGTGPSSFNLTANAPALNLVGMAGVDLYSYFRWSGADFPGFTYHYDFHGTVDSPDDYLGVITQMEIASGPHYYYSDYTYLADEFQTKMPYFQPVGGVINRAGDVTFAPIIIGDGDASRWWQIRWDFSGTGYDYDYIAAIPEPGTYAMLLAGLGLLGFAARRRKQ
jgi:hypothetical protein